MDATRHVVILAAEIADCARLTEANDDGSTDRLEAFRRNFVYPKLAEYNGRVLRAPGATLLVEFAEPIEAVQCAVGLQQEMLTRSRNGVPEGSVALRIGISMGEMKASGNDLVSRAVAALPIDELTTLVKPGTGIYGDSLNAAVALARLAEPGGICIPGPVRDAVHGQFPHVFEEIGARTIGATPSPVRCYRSNVKALTGKRMGVGHWRRSSIQGIGVRGPAIAAGVVATVCVWAVALWVWIGASPSKAPASSALPVRSEMPAMVEAGGKEAPGAAPHAMPTAKAVDANRQEAALQPSPARKPEADEVREAVPETQPPLAADRVTDRSPLIPAAPSGLPEIGGVVVKGRQGPPPQALPDGGATALQSASRLRTSQTAPESVTAVFRGSQADGAMQTIPDGSTAVVRGSQAPATPERAVGGVPEVVRGGGRTAPKT